MGFADSRRVLLPVDTEVALYRFIEANDFLELRSILKDHPDLLSDLALDKARRVVEDQIDERARRRAAERLALLKRCRSLGTDAAFGIAPGAGLPHDDRSTKG